MNFKIASIELDWVTFEGERPSVWSWTLINFLLHCNAENANVPVSPETGAIAQWQIRCVAFCVWLFFLTQSSKNWTLWWTISALSLRNARVWCPIFRPTRVSLKHWERIFIYLLFFLFETVKWFLLRLETLLLSESSRDDWDHPPAVDQPAATSYANLHLLQGRLERKKNLFPSRICGGNEITRKNLG